MKAKHPAHRYRWRLATWLIALVILLLALFEFVPVFTALQAGIAGLSIVIFAPLALIASYLAFVTWNHMPRRTTFLAVLSAAVAVLALITPPVTLTSLAKKEGVSLDFNLAKYISFTGDSVEPARIVVYKNVDGQQLRLALYQHDSDTARPTVLLLHGGGWQYGNYQRTNNWPKLLSDAGYQVLSLQYRLAAAGQPTWDKAPVDVRDAVSYIKAHAHELGVEPSQIALFGQSAGGHLALLEANTTSQAVQAAIGLYAPTDLTADYELSVDKDTELAFLGGTPTEQPNRYKAVSVPRTISISSPPTLLIQGTSDDIVSTTSSTKLSKRLESFGIPHRLVLLPYTGHSFDNQVGGFATQITEQVVLDFLSTTLGQ